LRLIVNQEMSTTRQRQTGKALTEAIKKNGVDVINSDEEQNNILDENQQERFISQMTLIAQDYVATWKRLLFYVYVIVIYIHTLSLIGLLSPAYLVSWTPSSMTVQLFISPLWLGLSSFSPSCILPVSLVEIATLVSVYHMHRNDYSQKTIRVSGVSGLLVWIALCSFARTGSLFWGRHLVLLVSQPLLCVAADTYVSSKTLAHEGIDKLTKFKYSYKKV
jgi:hypothetical protein